jgi:hypothetical protein
MCALDSCVGVFHLYCKAVCFLGHVILSLLSEENTVSIFTVTDSGLYGNCNSWEVGTVSVHIGHLEVLWLSEQWKGTARTGTEPRGLSSYSGCIDVQ